MSTQQMHLFPQGDDLPLFSGTPMPGRLETFQPREETIPARLFVCPTCQDSGMIQQKDKRVFCLCEAGQTAKARVALESLPPSKRTERLRELYAGDATPAANDPGEKVLRESLLQEPPNERLVQQGASALTTYELVSLVLGTTKDPTIAARLMVQAQGLAKVKALSAQELARLVPGMTLDRACRLLAALELSERVRQPREMQVVIKSPADAAQAVGDMATLEQEQMRVILLDTKNKIIHTTTVYQGSVNTTLIRVGELMKAAVRMNATAIVIAHNHPSGDPTPSPEDVAVTQDIVKAAKLLDIDCLDHIVIGEAGKFVSLKERGLGFA